MEERRKIPRYRETQQIRANQLIAEIESLNEIARNTTSLTQFFCGIYKVKENLEELCLLKKASHPFKLRDQINALCAAYPQCVYFAVLRFKSHTFELLSKVEGNSAERQKIAEKALGELDYSKKCGEFPEQAALLADQLENALMEVVKQEKTTQHNLMVQLAAIDIMEGGQFESWCAGALRDSGFSNVTVTPGSGDQGVDVLAEKDGIKYAVQCKRYSHDLGNTPVQEVYAGKEFYKCHVGAVMSNRYFTAGAKDLAQKTGVLLWDRDWIAAHIARDSSVSVPALAPAPPDGPTDEVYLHTAAVRVILETGVASVSMLQRRLKIGYASAARLLDQMEELGMVGPFQGSRPREILINKEIWDDVKECIVVPNQ